MSLVLYRKYRPKNFSEIIGQEKIVKILTSAVSSGRVAHAYLFTGPRGTGKTTIARILAKVINCTGRKGGEPCNECANCIALNTGRTFDVVEIDAASNTGVDNIRDLKESIGFSPALLKYKVFIIDEAHMLSKGAFNALLKMLEEPPEHAIFILATTEIHKIPPTIISRAQRFDFRKFRLDEMIERLKEIAKQEKVKIEKGVMEVIALSADGGMRDAESMLGQIISLEAPGEEIKLAEVKMVLGLTDTESVLKFVGFMSKNQFKEAIIFLNDITFEGQDLEQFAGSLIDILRKITILKTNRDLKKYVISDSTEEQAERLLKLADVFSEQELLWIFKKMITAKNEIKSAVLPQIPFEIALIEYDMFKNNRGALFGKKIENVPEIKKEPKAEVVAKKKLNDSDSELKTKEIIQAKETVKEKKMWKTEKIQQKNEVETEKEPEIIEVAENSDTESGRVGIEEVKANWNQILRTAKKYNHSISAFLKLSAPQEFKKDMLMLATPYKFHAEKLNDSSNRKIIDKVLLEVFPASKNIKVTVIQDENVKVVKLPEAPKKIGDERVDAALDVFGGELE
ncbi:DNA polymerase III subunit gamma/tau [Patescibacteria group bacterium]|nr:DNA polymerase III subunit gamma/tau [Patescibacteria group bacterium]MBU4579791.1 DNA polymerase III subunit gamma/tau [Patescibacteria group bacterium]